MSDELHLRILDLLPAYALGCLDEEEMILVAEYLAHSPAGQVELQAIQAVADHLALAVPEAAPPADLKQRLFNRIQLPPPTGLVQPSLSWWQNLRLPVRSLGPRPYWQVALLFLVLILLAGNLLLWRRVSQLDLTTEPVRMQAIPLTSTGLFPAANGFILISADGLSGAVVVDELPVLESDQQYQLWFLGDGESTSGALFAVDALGYGGTRVEAPRSLFEYSSADVTIEPTGGSPTPTGDRVLVAPLFNP